MLIPVPHDNTTHQDQAVVFGVPHQGVVPAISRKAVFHIGSSKTHRIKESVHFSVDFLSSAGTGPSLPDYTVYLGTEL